MDETIKLAYFSGIKVGIQSLLEALQKIANEDKESLTIELITSLASGCTAYSTAEILKLDCGNKTIEMLNCLKC